MGCSRLPLALLITVCWATTALAQQRSDERLRGGWYPADPYQYLDYSHRVPLLTGFDIEIERAIGRLMGVEIALAQLTWEDQLAALANGSVDIAAGATRTEPRERYAYFSKPYRTETDVLVCDD